MGSPAIQAFNDLMGKHAIRLTLRPVDRAPTSPGGALIAVYHVPGYLEVSVGKVTERVTLPATANFGDTRANGHDGHLEIAACFLPTGPLISTPPGPRPSGRPILVGLAVHEFLHAAGLDQDDHSPSGIFQAHPQVGFGASPDQDYFIGNPKGAPTLMPPFFLHAEATRKLREVW